MEITFKAEVSLESDGSLKAAARNFSLTIDEPVKAGGLDKGPTPTEYLLFSLGGCLGVAAQTVADEMGIRITAFKADLEGGLNPLKFLGKPSPDRAGYKKITARIKIQADAPRAKIEELLKKVEERCPISDNLSAPTKIELLLAP